jgi:hypothetical protein
MPHLGSLVLQHDMISKLIDSIFYPHREKKRNAKAKKEYYGFYIMENEDSLQDFAANGIECVKTNVNLIGIDIAFLIAIISIKTNLMFKGNSQCCVYICSHLDVLLEAKYSGSGDHLTLILVKVIQRRYFKFSLM